MCPICQQPAKQYLDYQRIGKGDYSLWLCRNCGLIYTAPLPADDFLEDFYQHYDSVGDRESYYRDLKNYRQTRAGKKMAKDFTRLAEKYHFHRGGKILDLGSGGGMFLDIIKRAGFTGLGVELSRPATEFAKNNFGVDCLSADAQEIELAEKFGAAFMWDLLEHLPRPEELIKKTNKWLAVGGYLVLETPNSRALINKIILLLLKFNIRWPAAWMFGYHHLFWHSRESLRILLQNNGFKILAAKNHNTSPARVFPWSWKFFLPRLALEFVNLIAALIGRKNKILIIAQKSES